jgi:antitoxin MazE
MQVSKWGNSLAVRLPAAVVEVLGLKVGDDIEVEVSAPRGSRKLSIRKAPTDEDVLARLRKYRGLLPADFKFDREEANRRR